MSSILSDPWILARIEEAVAPYVGVLPAEEVAWMRDQLAETLAGDEHAARILRGARPRVVDESGEVGCEPAPGTAGTPQHPGVEAAASPSRTPVAVGAPHTPGGASKRGRQR